MPYGTEVSKEQLDTWFNTPSSPALEGRKERQLQWFLELIENVLPDTGYCVGGRPSLADAHMFNLLGEHAPELNQKGEPFSDLANTNKVLESFPKIQSGTAWIRMLVLTCRSILFIFSCLFCLQWSTISNKVRALPTTWRLASKVGSNQCPHSGLSNFDNLFSTWVYVGGVQLVSFRHPLTIQEYVYDHVPEFFDYIE